MYITCASSTAFRRQLAGLSSDAVDAAIGNITYLAKLSLYTFFGSIRRGHSNDFVYLKSDFKKQSLKTLSSQLFLIECQLKNELISFMRNTEQITLKRFYFHLKVVFPVCLLKQQNPFVF